MTDSTIWIALATWGSLGAWLLAAALLFLSLLRVPSLVKEEVPDGAALPGVSVIVPLRNEAEGIGRTLRSLLAQERVTVEVIAVDDRSDDGSGEILRAIAAEDDRLRVMRVEQLPPQWLGKNHACNLGAGQAANAMLLFTDGDIVFAPGALARALALMGRLGVRHLTVAPELRPRGMLERAFQTAFGVYYILVVRAWGLSRAGSGAYAGVGAFNLVAREDYLAMGGHRRLAMEVLDDVKLGLILRRSGVPQALALSDGMVSVNWMAGFRDSLRGLQKNLFAGLEWSWGQLAVKMGGLVFLTCAPYAGLLGGGGPATVLAGAAGALLPALFITFAARRAARGSGLEGLFFPLVALTLAGASLASALSATLRGGISWRETRYSLRALRAGCVREKDWPRARAVGWG